MTSRCLSPRLSPVSLLDRSTLSSSSAASSASSVLSATVVAVSFRLPISRRRVPRNRKSHRPRLIAGWGGTCRRDAIMTGVRGWGDYLRRTPVGTVGSDSGCGLWPIGLNTGRTGGRRHFVARLLSRHGRPRHSPVRGATRVARSIRYRSAFGRPDRGLRGRLFAPPGVRKPGTGNRRDDRTPSQRYK